MYEHIKTPKDTWKVTYTEPKSVGKLLDSIVIGQRINQRLLSIESKVDENTKILKRLEDRVCEMEKIVQSLEGQR